MKMNQQRRSNCPISFSLESFGDMWSLLIIRDIVYFGKKTYGEFLQSDEAMATNILASRLVHLEQKGILYKKPYELDRRKDVYGLTEKGLGLIPILLEMAGWGALNDPETGAPQEWTKLVNEDKTKMAKLIRQVVENGGSIFAGRNSVVSSLGLLKPGS